MRAKARSSAKRASGGVGRTKTKAKRAAPKKTAKRSARPAARGKTKPVKKSAPRKSPARREAVPRKKAVSPKKPAAPRKGASKKPAARPKAVARKTVVRRKTAAARKSVPRATPRAAAKRPASRSLRTKAPAPSAASEAPRVDPAVDLYEAGLRAMFAQRWSEAARLFRRVLENRDGQSVVELQERALQQLHICQDQLASEADGSQEDPFLIAVVHKNAGEYEEALALCARGGRQSKDERFAYLAASIHALRGEADAAGRFLELAVGLNPKNRVHAFHDPDFQALREGGALEHLFRV